MPAAPASGSLVAGVRGGDVRAIARAITLVEDGRKEAREVLAALYPHAGGALVVGVTGPPGAGKSSLVDRLTALLRRQGRTVGVVAVDPTSPFSGGAILGDRIRMQSHATDPGVFIRSMATRGHLGGLAAATDQVVTVLAAAGKDVVLVETVGVGQDEVEVVGTADVSLVVLVPGLGDEVQALKAGIMEIADVFVVNKADRDGVDRVVAEVQSMLSLAPDPHDVPEIVKTVATPGPGHRGAARRGRPLPREGGDDRRSRAPRAVAGAPAARGRGARASRRARAARRAHRGGDGGGGRAARRARGRPAHRRRRHPRARRARVKPLRIDHLGIAVPSLEAAVAAYEALGFRVEVRHDVPTEKVRTAFLPVGESHVELLEPTDPSSVIARFLEKRSGLHHVCVLVDDLDAALAEMKARGVPLLDETPRVGAGGCRVAFVHPKGAAGVLLELKEERKQQAAAGPVGPGERTPLAERRACRDAFARSVRSRPDLAVDTPGWAGSGGRGSPSDRLCAPSARHGGSEAVTPSSPATACPPAGCRARAPGLPSPVH